MRVLHVYKDYSPVLGGIENHVKLLAEGQAAAGHDVTVLVTNRAPTTTVETLHGVCVIKASRLATPASTPVSFSLPWHLARLRPDVTHLHFPYPVGEVSQCLFGRGRPTVLTYHSDVIRQKAILRFYRPIMLRVLHSVDIILVTTANYLESSEILPAFRDKCRIVPLGIDRDRFLSTDARSAEALRQRYGGGALILFVGVLRYYKGVNYLLEAMTKVDARLLIVGEGPMGPLWRTQAQALGLGEKVTFAGRVSDEELPLYYRAADLFILPACERSEAFGLVMVEAMTSGTPVISTEVGTGTSYVNRHEESGLVVPPRDPGALARAINMLLSNESLRRKLAEGALARSTLFSAQRMLEGIQQIYDELVAR